MPEIDQFRHYDAPGRARSVSVQWEMLTAHDDTSDAPDERDDGFWPSLDPKAAGYIGENPTRDFETQQAEAEARMKAWREGDWHYIGVMARAHVSVPSGQGSFTCYSFDSAGLWGIESDSGDYIKTVFEEEKANLLFDLEKIGEWAATYRKADAEVKPLTKGAGDADPAL